MYRSTKAGVPSPATRSLALALAAFAVVGTMSSDAHAAGSQAAPVPARPASTQATDLRSTPPPVQAAASTTQPKFPLIPQDQGLPYTRSARPMALEALRDLIAVYPGSRYAYVRGHRVRLDATRLLDGEAVDRDNDVFVPESFAPLVLSRDVRFDPAPAYLAGKWVYDPRRPEVAIPPSVARIVVDGRPYVSVSGLASAAGLSAGRLGPAPSRIMALSDGPLKADPLHAALAESMVTLFDTPDRFADPSIATRHIPVLQRQGDWRQHVRATPEQLARLEQPPREFPGVPDAEFDLSGFNRTLLGSSVPPPGEYPRVLFSAADVPMLAERIRSNKYGQMSLIEMEVLFRKSWWDPTTSDGQIFRKLATGDLAGLEWPDTGPNIHPGGVPLVFVGQKPGVYSSHVSYIPECLTAMALWCLLNNDDARGREVAAAIANVYRLREKYVDEWNAYSDSEFGGSAFRPDGRMVDFSGNGAETHWRGMHGLVAHMNLALSLDFAGKWMTPEDRDTMRRIIAKATYGRRPFGSDNTTRFRDINWMTWDLPHFLALTAIEGLEGFDPEGYEQSRKSIRAFLDFGMDRYGHMWESNGKSGGGLQFQLLSMIALARRGENLFGHPHFRKMLGAQAQTTFPNGRLSVSSGTFSGTALSFQAVNVIKAFYPGDKAADYLMTQFVPGEAPPLTSAWEPPAGVPLDTFDPAEYRAKLEAKNGSRYLRLPSVTYPGFVRSVLYDTDWKPTRRAELNLPLDWNNTQYGIFTSSSDRTENATWINLHVRSSHYMGAGHHHSDAGMFQFAALGVNWFTEAPFNMEYAGKYHNQVLVDGESQPGQFPARAKYLGAVTGENASAASADLTYAYSWRWTTQPDPVWSDAAKALPWELEPADDILAIYQATGRNKMRPWWPSYNYSNFIPTSRAPFNPMAYVYRTVALVRGETPYAVVVDDAKKDDTERLYQWTAIMGPGVWKATVTGLESLPQGTLALAFRPPEPVNPRTPTTRPAPTDDIEPPAIKPNPGEPLLLVIPLGPVEPGKPAATATAERLKGPPDRQGVPTPYHRVSIDHRGSAARYRVLLLPIRAGDRVPTVRFTEADGELRVALTRGAQADELQFGPPGPKAQSPLQVRRDGAVILDSRP